MRVAAAGVALALVLAGCGSGGDGATFTAESFVAAVNDHGGGITLGAPLDFSRAEADSRELRFAEAGSPPPGAEAPADLHGAGTIVVFDSVAEADEEYERCEAAGLACFRAANVAVTFAGTVDPADLARLGAALRALEEG